MRSFRPGPLAIAAGFAVLLWLAVLFGTDSPLLSQNAIHAALQDAAWLVSGCVVVLAGGHAVLGFIESSGVFPTGMQRVLVYAVLTFAASTTVLYALGYDLRAVLATSALLTAAVGFAMQPTLGSMIGGIALHLDRALRVDDAIVIDGQRWRVRALTWRSVLGENSDGRLCVFPNNRLAEAPMVVSRSDQSARLECMVRAPGSVPPGQIAELLKEAVADFPQVDVDLPITVLPVEFETFGGSVRYQIRFFCHDGGLAGSIEPEVLARSWYVFQRNRIELPQVGGLKAGAVDGDELRRLIGAAVWASRRAAPWQAEVEQLATRGSVLLYAPGERVVPPAWAAGMTFLLLRGEAALLDELTVGSPDVGRTLPSRTLTNAAALRRMSQALAREIGPYSGYAVAREARASATMAALRARLAEEVVDAAGRRRFLAATDGLQGTSQGPGLMLRARFGADGWLTEPGLRAVSEVAVLAFAGEATS